MTCDCEAGPSLRPSGEKLPVCVGISLLVSLFAGLFTFYAIQELPRAELAGGAVALLMLLVVVGASVVNLILGVIARKRREPSGWLPAAIGIGALVLTIAMVLVRL
jgi:hypothetical protein